MTDKVIHPRSNHRIRSTVLVSALLFGIAACGSDEKSSSETSAATAAPTSAAAAATTAAAAAPTTAAAAAETTAAATETTAAGGAAGAATSVAVTESEFKIELGETTFAPGDYTFDITNGGEFKHNLVIEGPGVDDAKSDTFEGGQAGQLAVTLQAGTYELYCGVPTHKDKGMKLEITVA